MVGGGGTAVMGLADPQLPVEFSPSPDGEKGRINFVATHKPSYSVPLTSKQADQTLRIACLTRPYPDSDFANSRRLHSSLGVAGREKNWGGRGEGERGHEGYLKDEGDVGLVGSPPLVCRVDPHNLPLFDGVFDLGLGLYLVGPFTHVGMVRSDGVCLVTVNQCGGMK
ncbi:multifunctional CCA protein [Striga asiatica]|uniref:Multifunctional CCA protein n=1 Tax=Striga asiatica TaxID=4170 RepID=A0A5A7PWU6_STRAF|nr:multifunctional CCA protein [Striga asiatica]